MTRLMSQNQAPAVPRYTRYEALTLPLPPPRQHERLVPRRAPPARGELLRGRAARERPGERAV
jgi:hypothetical protein